MENFSRFCFFGGNLEESLQENGQKFKEIIKYLPVLNELEGILRKIE